MSDENYFFPWGGMKLSPAETQNDNGPLFAGTYYALRSLAGDLDADDMIRWLRMIKKIQVKPGLYSRYPGSKLVEAHDNYIGHLLASEVFKIKSIPKSICSIPLYNYNDQPPHEWRWETQRQGGDIALYQLAAGLNPNYLFLAWLSYGIGAGNVLNLCWARVELLRRIWQRLSKAQRSALRPGISHWFSKLKGLYLDKTIITHYYQDKDHPIIRYAKQVSLWHGEWWVT